MNNSRSNWYWTVSPYTGYVIRSEELGLNVAGLAAANATSECEFMEPCYAVDSDMHTRWTSEKHVLPQWLELTWNTSQKLRGIRIVFENAFATDYAVQTWNGTCWVNQTVVLGNSELEKTHDFAEIVETNKIRIYVTDFSDFYRVSIWELEAYSAEITSSQVELPIMREGNYMLAARVGMGPAYGDIYFKVNNDIFALRCNDSDTRFEWREMGPFHLTAENVSIAIGGVGPVELDEIMLYSLEDQENYLSLSELFNSSSPKVSVDYEQINPCKYRVHVNASEPFILVFSDTYDPLWLAFDGEKTISSTRAFALVNSFKIDEIGEFDIVVSFEGQTYVDVGLVVSFLTLVSIPIGFLISRIGVRRFKKRIALWRKGSWLLKIKRR